MNTVAPRLAVLLLGLQLLSLDLLAEPPSSEELLAKARQKAVAEHKTVFVHFGASWCAWCGRLDGFLDRADIKPVLERYFVPVELVVQEQGKNEKLNTPGADALLARLGGFDEGIPYFAFLDAEGALIVNSKAPGSGRNIGYPGEPAEVDWFGQMMRKAAPNASKADLAAIEAALRNAIKSAKP